MNFAHWRINEQITSSLYKCLGMTDLVDSECLEQSELAATVIIPCHNAASTLPEQLEALSRQTFDRPFELVFIDNGSTDDSLAVASAYADRFAFFRVVIANESKGAGYARNEGVKAATTERILFCDADDVAGEGWVAAMVDALDRGALVGGGREFYRLNAGWHPCMRKQSDDDAIFCDVFFSGGSKYRHVGAGNLGIRRSVFVEVGGFDSDLPVHEDADLCIKAQELGYTLDLCPEALMHIRCRQKPGLIFIQSLVWGYWSVALHKKHKKILGNQPVVRPILGLGRLFFSVVLVHTKAEFISWSWRVGWKMGRLYGSVALGVFVL